MISGTTFRCADKSGSFMNLGSILKGALGLVFGSAAVGGNSSAPLNDNYTNLGGALDSLINKWTGAGLTNAEKAANAFSAQQAELAFQRESGFQREMFEKETALANTAYQRQVADMKAAGLNPMLAAGGSGSIVPSAGAASSSAPSSVAPGSGGLNLGSILSMIVGMKQFGLQEKVANADIAVKQATAEKIASETKGINLDNLIKDSTKESTIEASRLGNELTRHNIKLIQDKSDEIAGNLRLMSKKMDTEVEQQNYLRAASIMEKASASQIVALLPYEQQYKAAATENQRQAALLAGASAAYKNHLIDDGYIDALIAQAKSSADSAEAKASLDKIGAAIRTGDYSKAQWTGENPIAGVLSGIAILLDNFNPLSGILK